MINILDIFKNKISINDAKINNLPFIIINYNTNNLDDYSLVVKINGPNTSRSNLEIGLPHNDNIFKLNYQKVYNVLKSNNINPMQFAPLGDIWSNKTPNVFNILLVNTNISIKPIDYVKIDNYYNYTIWKPIGPNGYSPLGFLASINKPSVNMLRLLPNAFLKEFHNSNMAESRNTNMNEYDLLATINEKYYTIDKLIFVKRSDTELNKNTPEILDVWTKQTKGEITLLEDDDPWHADKKMEHDKLLNNKEEVNDTENTDMTEETEVEEVKCINFNLIACSLLFLITLMISVRYFWK